MVALAQSPAPQAEPLTSRSYLTIVSPDATGAVVPYHARGYLVLLMSIGLLAKDEMDG